jgi:DnaJ-class molecular chaperone
MIFVLVEKPHSYFTREKDNLVFTSTITLRNALTGIKMNIPTLDGRNFNVRFTHPQVVPQKS